MCYHVCNVFIQHIMIMIMEEANRGVELMCIFMAFVSVYYPTFIFVFFVILYRWGDVGGHITPNGRVQVCHIQLLYNLSVIF